MKARRRNVISDKSPPWVPRADARLIELNLPRIACMECLGVTSHAAVSHYFHGRRPLKASQAFALAAFLGLSLEDLFEGDESLVGEAQGAAQTQTQRLLTRIRALHQKGYVAVPSILLNPVTRRTIAREATKALAEKKITSEEFEELVSQLI